MLDMPQLIVNFEETDSYVFHSSLDSTNPKSFIRFGDGRCKRG